MVVRLARGAKPFLKWAGGKSQLLPTLRRFYPPAIRTYVEPFLGGGAVYFDIQARYRPDKVILGDVNEELINCFIMVRDRVEDLIELLRLHAEEHRRNPRHHYYHVRDLIPTTLSALERAARLIYLNKTCYNGLYRVNREGRFNVPLGRYRNPRICDEGLLRLASRALQGCEIVAGDFEDILLKFGAEGDFIYLDPPYYPLSRTANFTAYSTESFTAEDQIRLARIFRELDRRGCNVLLSNSDTPLVRELYGGFRIHIVTASRAINSDPNGRGKVTELLITNYTP